MAGLEKGRVPPYNKGCYLRKRRQIMPILTEIIENLPDSESVRNFLGSLTLQRVIPTLAILIIGILVIRVLLQLFDKVLQGSRLEKASYGMLRTFMRVALYFILALLMAAQLGLDVTSLIAVVSVISLAFTLAVQGALTNVVGGITLLSTHPFSAGDFVEIGETSGTVLEVGVAYTKLLTPDNKTVSIPNSAASQAQITNFSVSGTRRVEFQISVEYGSDMEAVKAALLRASNVPTSLFTPAPFVGLRTYGDSAITYVLHVWTAASDYWTTYYAVNEAVAREFEAAGIVMTYPHLNVHLDNLPNS